jgi:hypothetical protein
VHEPSAGGGAGALGLAVVAADHTHPRGVAIDP